MIHCTSSLSSSTFLTLVKIMDCYTYCTATNYDPSQLLKALKKISEPLPTLQHQKDHFSFPYEGGMVFIFTYAVVIFWNVPEKSRIDLLDLLREATVQPLKEWEVDHFLFSYGPETKICQDQIIISENSLHHKLAISHALAQSSKLSLFEKLIQEKINETKHLPIELATSGKISLSRNSVAKKRGELFIARSSVNLHTDILDTPEFFWEHTEVEPIYHVAVSYLDLNGRVEVLNKRLDIVHELFEMLGEQLDSAHSAMLEWVIIILIAIEIAISLMPTFS